MHLNTLYGIFGKTPDVIQTIILPIEKMLDVLKRKIVMSILEISADLVIILLKDSLNYQIINQLKDSFKLNNDNYTNFNKKNFTMIKHNVAIASAVTAYARIHMLQFKNNPNYDIYYSDTDSIIVNKQLKTGKEIGELKDELNGSIISEAYFFAGKKYAYKFKDQNNNVKTISVFSGVERNSLN
jgi:hypothetical protein